MYSQFVTNRFLGQTFLCQIDKFLVCGLIQCSCCPDVPLIIGARGSPCLYWLPLITIDAPILFKVYPETRALFRGVSWGVV